MKPNPTTPIRTGIVSRTKADKINPQMLILAAILGVLVYGVVASTWGTLSPTLGFNDAQNGAIRNCFSEPEASVRCRKIGKLKYR
jgi:hypothetical protein